MGIHKVLGIRRPTIKKGSLTTMATTTAPIDAAHSLSLLVEPQPRTIWSLTTKMCETVEYTVILLRPYNTLRFWRVAYSMVSQPGWLDFK